MRQRLQGLVIYIHFLVVMLVSVLIWYCSKSTGVLPLLVGAEIISLRFHQARHHPGELFDRTPAVVVGAIMLIAGLVYSLVHTSALEVVFQSMTVISLQGVSFRWHQYIHPHPGEKSPIALIGLGIMATLMSSAALTIIARHLL